MVGPEYPGEGAVTKIITAGFTAARISTILVFAKSCNKVLREPIEDPALLEVDGTQVEEVDGASLNTWRVSGDWVALQNILSRGSTQIPEILI